MGPDHHSRDHSRRPGRKYSPPKSRKSGASLPPRHLEPYRPQQEVVSYQHGLYVDHDFGLGIDPSFVHSGSNTAWNDLTRFDPPISVYPDAPVYHYPDPMTNLSWGVRTLDLSEDPKPSIPVAPRCLGIPRTKYNSAHVLILTWSFHDLCGAFDEATGQSVVSLEEETVKLHDTFESYGYQVHEHQIPIKSSTEWTKATMKEFMSYANDETLLIVYYHGHGGLDEDGELVFSSHEHPRDAQACQTAAAELYLAMMTQESISKHDRAKLLQNLAAKYERFQPVAEIRWEEIRSPILRAPSDVLLILDCCAAGGANLRHVDWQPPPKAEGYVKHLYAACGFESSSRGDMTAGLCQVLEDYADRGAGTTLTTKRLHQIMEDSLQRKSLGAQPIFKQLLPVELDRSITIPRFLEPKYC